MAALGPYYLGVDIGSLTVKAVLLDAGQQPRGRGVSPAGYGGQEAVAGLIRRLLAEAGLAATDVAYAVVTGYGRVRFEAANVGISARAMEEVSEISCHARGAFHLNPAVRTVIDIGGQDSKAVRLDSRGRVIDFAMNDKCAAGTGRFLEVMATALAVAVDEFGRLALQSEHPVSISSTCTVFAESEVISLIAHGIAVEPILRGLHRSLIKRVVAMIRTVGLVPPLMLSGGVVQNQAIARMLEEETGEQVIVPRHPQLMGAYGAALIALGLPG